MTKKDSTPLVLPSERPMPGSRSLTFPKAAESNTPMQRFVKATKPALPLPESVQQQQQQMELFDNAVFGTTPSRVR